LTRSKKTSKSKKSILKNEKQAPSSIRKSSIPVLTRKTVYEGTLDPVPPKRKLVQNENEINPAFLPDHGYNWIGEEPKGKRIKLDKDTIVRKRIEYFRVSWS
jgi:hypothetical protein